MERRQLLPKSDDTRWQVYPSDDEVLMIRLLKDYSEIEKDAYMIRIMVNYFIESNEKQMDLIKYAQTFVRPKYDRKRTRRTKATAVASKQDQIMSDEITSQLQEFLKIIQDLKRIDDD